MRYVSKLMIPLFILGVLFYAFHKKIAIYDSFLEGAKDGLMTVVNIFPAVMAMVFAVNMFLQSHLLESLLHGIMPLLERLHIPSEVLPMALVRPISGTASLAILNDLFKNYGPDSFIGFLGSVLQGCTDTTIYVLALYFGSIKIRKTKKALSTGLFADFVGIVMAFLLTTLFF